MIDKCDWCGMPIVGNNEKYIGIWRCNSVMLDGNCVCLHCIDKYNKTIENFTLNLRKNKGKVLD